MTKNNFIYQLVIMSFLIALEIILTRFLSVNTQIVRIGFAFLPVAISAILFGPFWAGLCYAAGDLLGMAIFSASGGYFPGFTVSAFVTGVLYGLILYKKPITIPRVFLAAFTVLLVVTVGMNTLWLYIMYNKAFFVLLVPRAIEAAFMLFIQTGTIYFIYNRVLTLPSIKSHIGF